MTDKPKSKKPAKLQKRRQDRKIVKEVTARLVGKE
jgi:hypothetical protein